MKETNNKNVKENEVKTTNVNSRPASPEAREGSKGQEKERHLKCSLKQELI